ncbi:MAG: hypothetical protein ACR2FY_01210 [Pirellulaceae bacterium]
MMRHPFLHGIISAKAAAYPEVPSPQLGTGVTAPLSRRTFFGLASAAAAGLSTLILGRSSPAQAPGARSYPEGGGPVTTRAEGEARDEYRGDGSVTTQAVGEEGGGGYGGGGRVTTQAEGEEGGGWSGGGRVTTQAVGEEGGYYRGWRYRRYPGRYYYAPRNRQYYPPRRYTTYAVGEEGGGYYYR